MVEKNLDGVEIDPVKLEAELAELSAAVDAFAEEMKARLHEKACEGRTGWKDASKREAMYTSMLAQGAGVPMAIGNEADIANFALMLWWTRVHG